MVGNLSKGAPAGLLLVLLVVIALAMIALLGPLIHSLQEAAQIARYQDEGTHAELADFLRAELRGNRIADPYDPRWWGKKLTRKQYNSLERALDGFLNDTERDGQADNALFQALKEAGIHVGENLPDAVHAANHLVHNTKAPVGEPLPKQIKEDYDGAE